MRNRTFRRMGPLTIYGWGWDVKLPFGWWLVFSEEEPRSELYISNDATPPCDDNRGRVLWRGRYRRSAP